jgi:putative membrane protein
MKKPTVAAVLALVMPVIIHSAEAAPSGKSEKFAKMAAVSDMFEIESSQLALEKSDNQQVKDFAQTMVNDHQKTTDELKDLAQKQDLRLPQQPDPLHAAMVKQLKSAAGAKFDARYAAMQLKGHKQAVALFERYAKNGDNEQLKAWAEQTLPTLKTHLDHAQALEAKGHPQASR